MGICTSFCPIAHGHAHLHIWSYTHLHLVIMAICTWSYGHLHLVNMPLCTWLFLFSQIHVKCLSKSSGYLQILLSICTWWSPFVIGDYTNLYIGLPNCTWFHAHLHMIIWRFAHGHMAICTWSDGHLHLIIMPICTWSSPFANGSIELFIAICNFAHSHTY